MFVMNIILLIFSSVLTTIASTINSGDFVFPLEKSTDFSMCTFQNGTIGRCVNASKCTKAQDEYTFGIKPTLCHFVKDEPVVCCMFAYIEISKSNDNIASEVEKTTTKPLFDPWRDEFVLISASPAQSTKIGSLKDASQQLNERRKSVASCEDIYSLPAPFENIPGEFHITIVGGQNTEEGEFPHMAALGWTDDKNNIDWKCGGTLISHDYVLTAGHCVIGRTPPDLVRIGEKDLNADTLKTPQDFAIELIIEHPQYLPNQLYNDIALIKLNTSATITIKVRPACLWQRNSINFTDVTATGYGHTEFGGQSSYKLLKVDLKIFNNDECTKGYKNEKSLTNGIIESQLCAGDSTGEMDTCQGDSGGPIVVSTKNDNQIVYHVVGVTSFGKACATSLPGVYTRVSHYLDWIENIVWK